MAEDVDVVIVGGSIAGCTAAMLYGRAGLRVAVVERNRRAEAYKGMCGHFILSGTFPMLERTGLAEALAGAGAVRSHLEIWNGRAWLHPTDKASGMSLRRQHLDPLLRRLAVATPGVEMLLGHTVTAVLEDGDRITGIVATGPNGRSIEIRAALVVGADGHRSPVARLAGVPERSVPNERFWFWGYYQGIERERSGGLPIGKVWIDSPTVAICLPIDDGLTQLGVFAPRSLLTEFADNRAAGLERFIGRLPGAPELSGAVLASNIGGSTEYPFVRRDAAPRPGLALIGDAACASDPTPAVGCGWAFRTAEWLATNTAEALVSGNDRALARGVRRYVRARKVVDSYDRLARSDAEARGANPIERALFRAAEIDPDISARMARFAGRAVKPTHVLNPRTLLRAAWVNARRRPAISVSTAPPAQRTLEEAVPAQNS